ncbi:MAG: hypothetical protein ACLS8R_05280 [Anaeromassilibacillus sp.]
MNRIITIGREFGSGGREFYAGWRKRWDLPITIEIISEIAKRTSLSEQYVEANCRTSPVFVPHPYWKVFTLR